MPACRFGCEPLKSGLSTSALGASFLPTATASDYGNSVGGGAGRVGRKRWSLGSLARRGLLPTPTASDSKQSGSAAYSTQSGRHSGTTLTDLLVRGIQYLGTPTAHPRTHSPRQVDHGGQLANQVGGALSPLWIEWFMGLPLHWTATDCEPSGMPLSRNAPSGSGDES
jgi:hypothetical protein